MEGSGHPKDKLYIREKEVEQFEQVEEEGFNPWIALVVGSLGCGALYVYLGETALKIFDPASFLLVFGGSLTAASFHFSPRAVLSGLSLIPTFLRAPHVTIDAYSTFLLAMSEGVRREGKLFLESKSVRAPDDLSHFAHELALDGRSDVEYKSLLKNFARKQQRSLLTTIDVLNTLGACTPAMGLIGTLLGLIQLLGAEPSKFGAGLSLAVVTTLHGAVLSHLVFLPLAGRLSHRQQSLNDATNFLIEGMCALRAEETPAEIRERVASFL